MEATKRKLPERRNRGLRMAELEKNEEKLQENEIDKEIFKEEDSDDDFDIGDVSARGEEEEEPEDDESPYSDKEPINKKRTRRNQEKEILDIDQLDIDKIDYIEDLRDQGIDVSDEEAIKAENEKRKKNEFLSSKDISDDDDEDYLTRRKSKKKKKGKKKKVNKKKEKEKEENIFIETQEEYKDDNKVEFSKNSNGYRMSLSNEENYNDKQGEFIELTNKKRKRTNKFEALLKKPKREKLNRNVTILGSRHNPKSILISKRIYNINDEPSHEKDNDKKDTNEDYRALDFNLEQEMDTKKIIREFKQREKEKKQFNFQDKIISQEQRLLESIFTEWANKNSLKKMQQLEDLNKREGTTSNKKAFIDSVKIINSEKHIIEENLNEQKLPSSISKNKNKVDITFSNLTYYNKIFSFFNTKPKEKEKKLCAITGNPAKYYDPLTKSYYSTINAFKLLRERYFQKEEDNLLFRIQTLSDLASQKKERLKKMILTEDNNNPNVSNSISGGNVQPNTGVHKPSLREVGANAILNIVNKYGILKNEGGDLEKRVVSRKIYIIIYNNIDRIYNRNRENCVESGMLLEANKIKLVISKKIFKDKYSSKLPTTIDEVLKQPSTRNQVVNLDNTQLIKPVAIPIQPSQIIQTSVIEPEEQNAIKIINENINNNINNDNNNNIIPVIIQAEEQKIN